MSACQGPACQPQTGRGGRINRPLGANGGIPARRSAAEFVRVQSLPLRQIAPRKLEDFRQGSTHAEIVSRDESLLQRMGVDAQSLHEAARAFGNLVFIAGRVETSSFGRGLYDPVVAFLVCVFGSDRVLSKGEIALIDYMTFNKSNESWANTQIDKQIKPYQTTVDYFRCLAAFDNSLPDEYRQTIDRFAMPGPCALALADFQTLGVFAARFEGDPQGKKIALIADHLRHTIEYLAGLDISILADRRGGWNRNLQELAHNGIAPIYAQVSEALTPKALAAPEKPTLTAMVSELQKMIGLEDVKREVLALVNMARIKRSFHNLASGLPFASSRLCENLERRGLRCGTQVVKRPLRRCAGAKVYPRFRPRSISCSPAIREPGRRPSLD